MKVSIIVACYNQGAYLSETLESVYRQNYNDWECIIINDGSTDNTETVAKIYEEKDKRFKYIYQKNQGVCIARNKAISFSTGNYLICLDADDLISKDYIKKSVDILENNPGIKLVTCNYEYFGLKKRKIYVESFSLEKLLGHNLYINCSMFRKDDFEKTNGFNLNMNKGYEDWDFWITLLKNGGDVYILDGIHFFYRIKRQSRNISAHSNDNHSYLRKQIWQNHKDLYSRIYSSPLYSYEYLSIKQSLEYRLGSLLVYPIRKFISCIEYIKEFSERI